MICDCGKNVGLMQLLMGSLIVAALNNSAAAADVTAAWVQYTTDGPEVRAVVEDTCPQLVLDGVQTEMKERAGATSNHPNTVCASQIPEDTQSIQLAGTPLPVPALGKVRKIAIVGDTGCRVSDKHGLYQACNNNSEWPFAKVAVSIEAFEPDLIVYLGDYIYRESPCPEGNNGCKGAPYGDILNTWMVDWLVPAAPIHRAAPLVLIRGNHETCERAGLGWFRYLDARAYTGDCETDSDPWIAKIDPLHIAVLDTAYLKDDDGGPLVDFFEGEFNGLSEVFSDGKGWIATHRPIWGIGADDDTGEPYEPTAVLQKAANRVDLAESVELILGSHLHLAEAIDFAGDRPPQIVVGNGGTQLVPAVDLPGQIDGVDIDLIKVFYQFGFTTMELGADQSWSLVFRDVRGRKIEQCTFDGEQVSCP